MQKRMFGSGNRSLEVTALGLGCMRMSHDESPIPAKQEMIALIRSAVEQGATPAQIALAWLLAQKPWIVPIPGSRKIERLDENIGALAVQLSPDDLQEINKAISTITVQGDRYPEQLERMTGI